MQPAVNHTALCSLCDQKDAIIEQLQFTVSSLQLQLKQLNKLIYGSKQERFVPTAPTSTQMTLDIQPQTVDAVKLNSVKKVEYTRISKHVTSPKPHPGRNPLPAHLPRREQVIEPAIDCSGLKRIGEEITEELDYEPGKLFVNRIIRPKYKQPNEAMLIAPMPERPLPKAIAGAGLLAQIVTDK